MSQLALKARRLGRLSLFLVPALLFIVALPHNASAQGFTITISVDENGHGNLSNSAGISAPLPFAMLPDPGPGGLASALTFGLLNPPGLIAGDLVLLEPGSGVISDLIRFNPAGSCSFGTGCLVFYSDNLDGADALADVGFPLSRYTNLLTFQEVGPEGNNGFIYTPTAGQPGFVALAGGPVTYILRSDSVPEFSSLGLLAIGLVGVVMVHRKRNAARIQSSVEIR